MLVNFEDAFIFVIWAETEYIFASEDVCRRGNLAKMSQLHFHLQVVV